LKLINDKSDSYGEHIRKDVFSTLYQKYPSSVFILLQELISLILNAYDRSNDSFFPIYDENYENIISDFNDEKVVYDVDHLRDDKMLFHYKGVDFIFKSSEDSTKPISLQILGNCFFFNLNIVGNSINLNTQNLNTTISSPQLNPYWICHSLDTSIKTQPTNYTTPSPSCSKDLSHRVHTINISTTPLPNTHYKEIITNGCNSVIEDCIPLSVPELLQELERFNHDVMDQNHHYNYYDNMEPSLDTVDDVGDNEREFWWKWMVNWECCCDSYNIWRKNDKTQGKELDMIEKTRAQENKKEKRRIWNENKGEGNRTVSTEWSECGRLEVEDFYLEA